MLLAFDDLVILHSDYFLCDTTLLLLTMNEGVLALILKLLMVWGLAALLKPINFRVVIL